MGIMRELLGRERRNGDTPSFGREGPSASAQLFVLLPDHAGVASYQLNCFSSAGSAELFVDSVLRGNLPHGSVLFWGLQWDPGGAQAEALVLIRDTYRGVVYPFSFADLDSAHEFVRHEIERGLDIQHVMLYWALPARLEADFWGRASISPASPPVRPRGLLGASPDTGAGEPAVRIIHFEGASQRVRAKAASQTAWGNFFLALEEALDARAVREASGKVVWSRAARALAEAAELHCLADRDRAARQIWWNVGVALADAHHANSLEQRAAASRTWRSISYALESALAAKAARDEWLRGCWRNATAALAEATQSNLRRAALNACWQVATEELGSAATARAYHSAACLAWRNATSAIAEAAEVEMAVRESNRRRWHVICVAAAEAAELATFRATASEAWLSIASALAEACEAARRYRRAVNAWRNISGTLAEAGSECRRREDERVMWHTLSRAVLQALVADAKLRIARTEDDYELMAAVDSAIAGNGASSGGSGEPVRPRAPYSWPTTWRMRDDDSIHGFSS